ncbi:DoxX family membrane protein [Rhodococcus qingshengii]|uniref:DoxX family membrane protein n=1 Tax=Rhodococcus qingshengii TaxID=334542 RepID=UPI001BEA6495|nr:DoxX family membrane protein [Rhodococcus qingshengii]MBT2269969.1 DoxX family membrane protein [Rhodococcus qingshengii]
MPMIDRFARKSVRRVRTSDVVTVAARVAQSAVYVLGGRTVWSHPAGAAKGASKFLTSVRNHLRFLDDVGDEQLVKMNAAVMFSGGLLVGTGLAPRIGSAALIGSMVPTTLAAFPFWTLSTGPERSKSQSDFLKNLGLVAGLATIVIETGRR